MSNRKGLLLAIAVIVIGLFITAGSYAFWSWASDINKSVAYNTAKALQNYIIYEEGNSQFTGEFKAVNSYTQGMSSTITISKTSEAANIDMVAIIHMDINRIGDIMKSSPALKWVVTQGNQILGQGNFVGANSGDTLDLVNNIEVTTTPTVYTIYIWLDKSLHPSNALSGETLDTNVWTEITQTAGIEDRFEITRINANYQNISATVVDSKHKVTHYAVVTSGSTPSSWTSIGPASNIFNLNTSVNAAGTYDVYFKDEINKMTHKSVTVSSIDTTAPSCTFGSFTPAQVSNNETATIDLTCTDNESEITVGELHPSDIVPSSNSITVTIVNRSEIAHGYKYTITVRGTENDGEPTLSFAANKIRNAVCLGNAAATSTAIVVANQYTVRFASSDNHCTLDVNAYANMTATYGDVINIPNPSCTGFSFAGWTANSGLDTTNAKYGDSSSSLPNTWSNALTPVTATYFKDLANKTTKDVTLIANWAQTDYDGPELSVNASPSGINYSQSKTVTITISDNTGLKPGTYTFKYGWSTNSLTCNDLTDTTTITVSNQVSSTSTQVTIDNQSGNGTFYMCTVSPIFDVLDNQLNAGFIKTIAPFKLDNIPPTATLTASFSNLNVYANLTGMSDSGGSGITGKYYYLSDHNVTCDNTITDFTQYNYINTSFSVGTVSDFGTYYVCIKLVDGAGNATYLSDSVEAKAYLQILDNTTAFFKEPDYRDKITNISFVNYIDLSNAISGKDPYILGEGNNDYIKGWLELNDVTKNTYDLYIGANNTTIYGRNFTNIFYNMRNVSSFNFSALNTSEVNSMVNAFRMVGADTSDVEINLGNNFDASNVIQMSYAFSSVGTNATNIDINLGNNFNVSKADSMLNLFSYIGSGNINNRFININLGNNFNASNIYNMANMFYGVGINGSGNININLGNNFNASSAVNMSSMFSYVGSGYNNASSNINIDLGNNFNSVKAQNMARMFAYAGANASNFSINYGDGFNTSNVTDMGAMFSLFVSNIPTFSFTISNKFDVSNVKNMGSMFSNLGKGATNLTFNLGDNFDTSNVIYMSDMFRNLGRNDANFQLNLGDKFNTSNVTSMYGMFDSIGYKATNFNLNLGDKFDTSKVTVMNFMFRDTVHDSQSFTINFGDKFDTSKVINMQYMFFNFGYSAENFDLRLGNKFDAGNVIDANLMFCNAGYNANSFNLHLGNNFNLSSLEIWNGVFLNIGFSARNFTLNLGNNFNVSNVTDMSNFFANIKSNSGVESVILDLGNNFNASHAVNMFGMFRNAGINAVDFSLNLGNNFNATNVTNMRSMFSSMGKNASNSFNISLGNNFNASSCINMSNMFCNTGMNVINFSLDLGGNFGSLHVTDMSNMFDNTGHYSRNFFLNFDNNLDTSNVTNMYGMFRWMATNSTNFYLGLGNKFNTINVIDMSDMFCNAGGKAVNYFLNLGNNFDTSNVKLMTIMFDEVGGESTNFNLNLGDKFDTSNVTNMYGMFRRMAGNSTNFYLDLGNKFDTSNVTNMYGMFGSSGINSTNINIFLGNKFNTYKVTDIFGMFSNIGINATNVTINLGSNFDTSNVNNMYYVFFNLGRNATNFHLDLGNKFDTSNVIYMSNIFGNVGRNATNFSINLGNKFDISNVKELDGAFSNVGRTTSSFAIDLGSMFNTSNVVKVENTFAYMGYSTQTNFVLNMSAGNFANITSSANMFAGFPFSKATIYVKDKNAQNWMLARSANFNVNNVLIYNANYYLNGGEFESEPEYFMEGRSTNYTVPQPVKTGYTFAGWTGWNGDTPNPNLVIPAGTSGIIKLYANWELTTYTITYNYDGGSMVNHKDTYDTTETFTLNIPYKANYIFEGWTGSNGSDPQMQVIVPTGTYGNLTYTAHYRAPVNDAERTLAMLHSLGGNAVIGDTTGTTNGTCPEVDSNGDMTIASIDNSAGRMCEAIDDYGTSLVFRGNVDNNYVQFGTDNTTGRPLYWRIIRINGDGTIRMIYAGTKPYLNNASTTDKGIGSYKYNAFKTDNAYVGYMYGITDYVSASGTTFSHGKSTRVYYSLTPPEWRPQYGNYILNNPVGLMGSAMSTAYIDYYTFGSANASGTGTTYRKVTAVAGTGTNGKTVTYDTYSRRSESLAEAQTNTVDSTIKYYVDDWYQNMTNLSSLASGISDNVFCNDRSISEFVDDSTGMGYGGTATQYRYYYGPWSTSPNINNPNLKCITKNDRFTVSDTTLGNGALTYPVGLINEDEVIAAGGYNADNNLYYLYSGNNYFTMTPVSMNSAKSVSATGKANTDTAYDTASYVRPVINLKASSVLSGYGTRERPFAATAAASVTYLIDYALNNGTLDNPINSYTPSSATFTLNNPTRTGYTFAGWTGSNGDTPELTVTIPSGSAGNLWYTANWTANDYTVTLSSASADTHGTTSTTVTYDAALPDITIPEKINYAFVGYYTEADGGGTQYYDYQGRGVGTWVIADDTTLYAYMVPKVITLDEQSPTTNGDSTVTAIYNEYLPTLNTLPTKTGYYFFGYYTEAGCAGTKYMDKDGAGVTAWTATSPTLLYACWSEPIKPKDKWATEAVDTNGYLFSGASSTTYNYIRFSNTSFRIIGLFDNRLKIVRTSSYSSQKYNSSAGNNVWANVSLKTYLNSTFYNSLTADAKAMISAYPFKVGSCAVAITASAATQCIATLTDSAIVGLMDIADYGMSSSSCKGGSYNISAYNTNACKNSTWMAMNEWTLTPVSGSTTNAIRKNSNNANSVAVTTSMATRPVVYLNEDVYITGGSGKSADPYMLEIIE